MISDTSKILLNKKEKRLLKYIEKHELWEEDRRVKTPEFKAIENYGMLIKYVNKSFPIKLVTNTQIPESNVYKVSPAVSQYWREEKAKLTLQRQESRRYWITTIIAILALVLAGISLAAQLGLVQIPKA